MYASDIEIKPHQGWANIQLGCTIAEVRAALATNGHAYDLDDDEFFIDIYSPNVTFYFDDTQPKRLVQIAFYDKDHRIDAQPVIGLTLAEALLAVQPQSFEDSLWSLVSIEEEYQRGKPLADSERLRRSSPEQNLQCGTLWVLSRDVGIVMLDSYVHALAIRMHGEAPCVGCGRLDAETMEMALDAKPILKDPRAEKTFPDWLKMPAPIPIPSGSRKPHSFFTQAFLVLLAIGFLAVPLVIVYRDLTAWKGSLPVVGIVVETKSEGPFVEEVVVQYTFQGSTGSHRVAIPATYTTVREVGQEVELLYLPDEPHRAMTRIQIRDEGWSLSPYYLFGSIGLSTLFLHLAFPNHIRLNSRKR